MRFTWDPAKNVTNLRDHGLDFETALNSFRDEQGVSLEAQLVDGELREVLLGASPFTGILYIVFTERNAVDQQILRLISAGKADRNEKRIYFRRYV